MITGVFSIPFPTPTQRRFSQNVSSAALREYFLGPENALLLNALNLGQLKAGQTVQFEFSPIYVHAPSGYGKSDLLTGVAEQCRSVWKSEKEVLLTEPQGLSQEFQDALKLDSVSSLHKRLMRPRLLLIDDIGELKSKPSTQDFLTTVIDARFEQNRPIIAAGSKPLYQLRLSDRLTSRIANGLVIPIREPSDITRKAITKHWAANRGFQFESEALEQFVAHHEVSPSELLGLLTQLVSGDGFQSEAEGLVRTIRLEDLGDRFQNVQPVRSISPQRIIQLVSKHYGLKTSVITGSSRRKQHAAARSMAMYLLRSLCQLSYHEIGKRFGNRDHSTVMHSCRKVESNSASDKDVQASIQFLTELASQQKGTR